MTRNSQDKYQRTIHMDLKLGVGDGRDGFESEDRVVDLGGNKLK